MSMFQSKDIALVTGAGSGIGRETCKLLAQQGATVVATDINKMAADQTVQSLTGTNHLSLRLDVVKPSDVEAVFAEVVKKYSWPPNIVINCAGLMLFEPLLALTEDTYYRVFDVNVKGTILVTQIACREMIAAKRPGSIVNIASIAKEGVKGFAIYAATKGAVEAFSRTAAKEFGPQGIRVNVVSPGFTDTPMMTIFSDDLRNQYCQTNPLGRLGKPDEIAELLVFLASSKSSYINGASIPIHGGQM